jgi:hypothetical protein
MLHPLETQAIYGKLNRAQVSTITSLDENYCILGCAEACAIRLTKANGRRPALVKMRQGERYKEFALTREGLAIRAYAESLV